MNIEQTVLKFRLHRSVNQLIFNTVFDILQGEDLLKVKNSYTFSVTSPVFRKKYLMVENFPDEEGFAQVQIVDESSSYTSIDLKIINNFDSLLEEIKQFLAQQFQYSPIVRNLESLDFVR